MNDSDKDSDEDFASAAMLRLIRLGLQRQGLALPRPPAAGAHVPLADKRALLQTLMDRHGPAVIFRIGEAVQDAPEEPTLTALLPAADPPDLVRRFQRLERYVHSRHRVEVVASGHGRLRLRHVSLKAGEPPLPAEDLLVWGLLTGLLQRLGTLELASRFHEGTAVLDWRWRPAPPLQPPQAPVRDDTTAAARARLSADCAAPWSLAHLAATLGLTPRTLQRRLAEAGSGFSPLLTEVRLAAAGQLLAAGTESTAQIGFRCGFADQAHFTRSFHHHTALTPARYRREFGAGR